MTATTNTTTTIMASATPLAGQVGGFNTANTKRPMLHWKESSSSSSSDRVLKPVRSDVRGIREVTFYEALQVASAKAPHGSSSSEQSPPFSRICHQYANFLMGACGGKSGGATSQAPSRTARTTTTKKSVAPENRPLLWGSMILRRPRPTHSHNNKQNLDEQQRVLLMALKEEVIALRRLKRFTPLYHGVVQVDCHSYLCLEDLTQGFVKPNVMDVKLGTQTFEPDAPHDKRLRELQKYPQQSEFGLRIVGMRVCNPSCYHPPEVVSTIVPPLSLEENGYRSFDKHFGRSLSTRDLLLSAFRIFLNETLEEGPPGRTTSEMSSSSLEAEHDDSPPEKITTTSGEHTTGSLVSGLRTRQRAIVSNVLEELKAIRNWFELNRSFCFCASSLFIVYEGDTIRESSSSILQPEKVQVKLIDFARVRRSEVGDPGYIVGLTSLMNIMAELMQETTTECRPL